METIAAIKVSPFTASGCPILPALVGSGCLHGRSDRREKSGQLVIGAALGRIHVDHADPWSLLAEFVRELQLFPLRKSLAEHDNFKGIEQVSGHRCINAKRHMHSVAGLLQKHFPCREEEWVPAGTEDVNHVTRVRLALACRQSAS